MHPARMINKKNKKIGGLSSAIAVIGIGRVGLPLSLVLADVGYRVIGIGRSAEKYAALADGVMPFKEEGAEKLLRKHYGKLFTLGDYASLSKCKIVFICVGTFLTEKLGPDLSEVYRLIDQITPYLSSNTLIILRSTVEPNGSRKIYSYLKKKSKKPFLLAYAPERIAEGFALRELYTLPQIIGSFDDESFYKAENVFRHFAPEVIRTDPLSAELAKLILNTYRYATFAVVNELMMIAEHFGRNIYDILDIANKDYPRGNIPTPGLAAGPCLVKDGFFLRHNTPYNTMITGSYSMNEMQMIDFIIKKLKRDTGIKNKKIAILGLAFKKNIDDDRGSLSLPLIAKLQQSGAAVTLHDPLLGGNKLSDALLGAEIVIIAINHDEYTKLTLNRLVKLTGIKSYICDIWNVLGENRIFIRT